MPLREYLYYIHALCLKYWMRGLASCCFSTYSYYRHLANHLLQASFIIMCHMMCGKRCYFTGYGICHPHEVEWISGIGMAYHVTVTNLQSQPDQVVILHLWFIWSSVSGLKLNQVYWLWNALISLTLFYREQGSTLGFKCISTSSNILSEIAKPSLRWNSPERG